MLKVYKKMKMNFQVLISKINKNKKIEIIPITLEILVKDKNQNCNIVELKKNR
jgi:hypothetical protein